MIIWTIVLMHSWPNVALCRVEMSMLMELMVRHSVGKVEVVVHVMTVEMLYTMFSTTLITFMQRPLLRIDRFLLQTSVSR